MPLYLGIDPGLSGAVAVLDREGRFVGIHDTPTLTFTVKGGRGKGPRERRDYLLGSMVQVLDQYTDVDLVGIETAGIQPRAKDGVLIQKGQNSLLHIGRGVGLWQGMMAALDLSFVSILPAVWKRRYGLLGQDKKASLILAQQRWPTAPLARVKDIGRADALWLADYTRVKDQSVLKEVEDGAEARP